MTKLYTEDQVREMMLGAHLTSDWESAREKLDELNPVNCKTCKHWQGASYSPHYNPCTQVHNWFSIYNPSLDCDVDVLGVDTDPDFACNQWEGKK